MPICLQDVQLLAFRLLVVACCCRASDITSHVPFCLLIKSEYGTSQVSFLMNTTSTSSLHSLVFYWSMWTSDERLEDCFMSNDWRLVEHYLSYCQKGSTSWDQYDKFNNLTALLEDDSLCQKNSNMTFSYTPLKENTKQVDSKSKNRNKRAWVLPGTLWCGRGTNANDYEQLGMFEHADRCCREHDHCEHIIRSFSVNFGVFNPTFFTVSHCDCDYRFRQCLLSGNDTVSNMVGYSFFNVLKLRCFNFIHKRQCTQYNWLGLCTMVTFAPIAVMKEPTPYNSTNLTNEKPEILCNEKPAKLAQGGKKKISKTMRLTKNHNSCTPTDYIKEKQLQLSENIQFKKKKSPQTNKKQKERKYINPNSMMNVTSTPERKSSKKKYTRTKKQKMKNIIQSTAMTHVSPPNVFNSSAILINIKKEQKKVSKKSKHLMGLKEKTKQPQTKRKMGEDKKLRKKGSKRQSKRMANQKLLSINN
ncbi:hypothetical protein DNTS_002642 [Danionella cerebrum]|uniref:phospholipase A2 n=1 Tax=Danionella cerebrum TaxID=2873325 RepID=A0A553QKI8_9TELE|nr:hypothetical protein DNTS_002642 [Danionella translucida]